MTSLCC